MSEQEHIIKLERKIDSVEKSVNEIKTALIGNDLTNKQGVIHDVLDHGKRIEDIEHIVVSHRIETHEQRLQSVEKKIERAQAWLLGAGFILGIIGYKAFTEISSLLK